MELPEVPGPRDSRGQWTVLTRGKVNRLAQMRAHTLENRAPIQGPCQGDTLFEAHSNVVADGTGSPESRFHRPPDRPHFSDDLRHLRDTLSVVRAPGAGRVHPRSHPTLWATTRAARRSLDLSEPDRELYGGSFRKIRRGPADRGAVDRGSSARLLGYPSVI